MANPSGFGIGPFTGVNDTGEPFDDGAGDRLSNAYNVYFPNPKAGSGAYARPGINTSNSLTVAASSNGQGTYTHTALDGTVYNFVFAGGKVWRQSTTLATAPVDVTPTNIILGTAKFVYATSLAGYMIVNDGVNKPWLASNLGSTPITATVIEQRTPAVALSTGSNDVRLANAAFTYTLRAGGSIGTQATFAANATGTAIGALGTLPATKWVSILVELNSSAALVFTAASGIASGYATEALAIAALPARTATRWYVGYVTVQADGGASWIAGTDAFYPGTTGNQAQATNFYAGEGAAWSAYGQPVIYTGAVFFILQQLAATYARTTITWSEPNLPDTGYQQTDYDDAWTLTQTSSEPLYALASTNDALYYFRQGSIGAVAGAPGVNFQGTASHDVVSGNVGCVSSATVKTFLNYVYFVDANGRPYRFPVGGTPEPIWQQARRRYEDGPFTSPTLIEQLSFAAVEPNLNVILFGTWPQFGSNFFINNLYVFDLTTGTYFGVWGTGSLISETVGFTGQWDVVGTVKDSSGYTRLCLLPTTAGTSMPVYFMGVLQTAVWTDSSAVPVITIDAGWLGYDGKRTFRGDTARLMQANVTSCTMVATPVTSGGANTMARTPPSASVTGVGRSFYTLNTPKSRGLRLTVTPATATAQWRAYRVEVDASDFGTANVEDA